MRALWAALQYWGVLAGVNPARRGYERLVCIECVKEHVPDLIRIREEDLAYANDSAKRAIECTIEEMFAAQG